MDKKIKSLDEAPVDMVEAVRRASMRRGFIPRKSVRQGVSKLEAETNKKSAPQKAAIKTHDEEVANQEPEQPEAHDETEPGEIHEKLIDITEKAHDVLFEADTVFPFTLFPSTITLDREKLTIANREFFRVAKIITVPITSMISAEADVGPFFGSIKMTSKYFIDNKHEVHYLWRQDAVEIHRLLQGFIISQEKGIDASEVNKDDLKVLLHDLGQGASD